MQAIQVGPDNTETLLQGNGLPDILTKKNCVYVFSETDFDRHVRRASDIQVHKDKHPDKSLAQYLLPKNASQRGATHAIFAAYSHVGRFRQSIEKLLAASEKLDFPNTLALGIPDQIFTELSENKEKSAEDIAADSAVSQYDQALSDEDRAILACIREEFRGTGPEADRVRYQIVEAAACKLPVLILGETGTGKEVAARLIHKHSLPDKSFMAVNCGAIPSELFESELFGHEPFAFSGAGNRLKRGLWELANGGILFLDEIGDLPLAAQVKILRALENGVIRRVGGEKNISVDARIIAATHRDLFHMVETGAFREDLFYRLRLFVIRTPSLTENGAHLEKEVQILWRNITDNQASALSKQVLKMITNRAWVGNYRDIKNFLRALWEHVKHSHAAEVRPLHVRAIEERYGPSPKAPQDPLRGELEHEVWRMRCNEHQDMCAESLRALQLAITPMTKRGCAIPDDLEMRLRQGIAELALFLRKPRRFFNANAFRAIDSARVAAEELFDTLLSDRAKVRARAKKHTLSRINDGLDAMFSRN